MKSVYLWGEHQVNKKFKNLSSKHFSKSKISTLQGRFECGVKGKYELQSLGFQLTKA